MSSDVLVYCEKVTREYGEGDTLVRALDEVTLSVCAGEFVSLCGPSGSGKTTLLNCIAGLDTPTSGQVTLAGKRIDSLTKAELANVRLHDIGFVFQSYNLIPVLSAQENVEFVMEVQGGPVRERRSRAREVLKEVGLEGLEDRRPGELSGGQQQRVAVARAIASRPPLILADEPTANLDSTTSASLVELMREMNEVHGTTFIFSTHDTLVMDRAKRLIRMQDGSISSDEVRTA